MSESNNQVIIDEGNFGTIKISDDVVKIIAGLAATEVSGISAMSGGLAGGIAERLGHKNLSKGVKAEVGESEASVELHVIVEYGCQIHNVAKEIQTKVKKTVENMTGLSVTGVNVNVHGVSFPNENKE